MTSRRKRLTEGHAQLEMQLSTERQQQAEYAANISRASLAPLWHLRSRAAKPLLLLVLVLMLVLLVLLVLVLLVLVLVLLMLMLVLVLLLEQLLLPPWQYLIEVLAAFRRW